MFFDVKSKKKKKDNRDLIYRNSLLRVLEITHICRFKI